MTLLLIPTTLFAFFILTSLVASFAKQPTPIFPPVFPKSLRDGGAGYVTEQLTQLDTQLVEIPPVTQGPIKVRLRWRSDSMGSAKGFVSKGEEMQRPSPPDDSKVQPETQINGSMESREESSPKPADAPRPPPPINPQDQSRIQVCNSTIDTKKSLPKSSEMPPPLLPSSQDLSQTQTTARSMKRFSIQLPLQSTRNVAEILSTSAMTSPQSPSLLPTTPTSDRSATPEANDFLTALASQERRVLELKEELEKAEADLTRLKKQWAIHEATKKRNELRHAVPLRPLKSPKNTDSEFQFQPNSSKNEDEEQRRRTMSIKTKQPQRTVFEGRHTRTLSLLSPTSLAQRGNVSMPTKDHVMEAKTRTPKTGSPTRSTATVIDDSQQARGTRDDLVHTGRQFVGDLKDGLWTFIEDLKSATVGDEALTAARSRQLESTLSTAPARSGNRDKDQKTPNRPSMPPRNKAPKTASSYVEAPAKILPTPLPPRKSSLKAADSPQMKLKAGGDTPTEPSTAAAVDDGDDGWSNWDSPPSKDAASNFSTTSPSTPRSSLSEDIAREKRRSGITGDQIPWPALQKLTPSNLTRTASNLMMEWEKSLNDPLAE